MKIIIAEDNPASLKLMEKILAKQGEDIFCAKDGKEAIKLIQKTGARLILSDWLMPNMDGLSLCQAIRKSDFHGYVYIILLTSKSEIEDTLSAFDAGADDYIVKPFNPKELLARIKVGKRTIELEDKYKNLHVQLLQSEKMAAVGQLSAGIAHEINNPVGFVSSNLKTLLDYAKDITPLMRDFQYMLNENLNRRFPDHAFLLNMDASCKNMDFDFILSDMSDLISDCIEGSDRISRIVSDMKTFAHPGSDHPKYSDINQCIDSTLNVVWNEIKYNTEVIKDYGKLEKILCFPQKLNQVFMNIIINAAQAMEEKGKIKISTRQDGDHVKIIIADNGKGIAKENISKIFNPFFTTKPVGKGTGLGLNLVYNIIKSHYGKISVKSEVGKGTAFIIQLPVKSVGKEE